METNNQIQKRLRECVDQTVFITNQSFTLHTVFEPEIFWTVRCACSLTSTIIGRCHDNISTCKFILFRSIKSLI